MKFAAGGKHMFSVTLSGIPIGEALDALAPLFGTPPKLQIDGAIEKSTPRWTKRLAASKKLAYAWYPEDPDDDDATVKTIVVNPEPGTVKAHAPEAFTTADEVLKVVEALPFTLCTIGEVGTQTVVTQPEAFPYHFALGWGCAFRGKGHDVLVSRRWLEFGPWQLIRRPKDLSILLFHELDANTKTAVKQAQPGHVRMAGWETGGFMRDADDLTNGQYTAKDRKLEIIVNRGEKVSQQEMTGVCAARAERGTGKDRIERVAYLFADQKDAWTHLHEMWLREIEVWYVGAKGPHRIDDDYNPKARPPAWASGRSAGPRSR